MQQALIAVYSYIILKTLPRRRIEYVYDLSRQRSSLPGLGGATSSKEKNNGDALV